MHRIAWNSDGFEADSSVLMCLFTVCLSRLPILMAKAIVQNLHTAYENEKKPLKFSLLRSNQM